MSDTSAVPLSVELTEQSVNVLTQRIADALGRGVTEGLGDSNGPLNRWADQFADRLRAAADDYVTAFTQATRQAMSPMFRLLNDFISQSAHAGAQAGNDAGRAFTVNFEQWTSTLGEATRKTVQALDDMFGPAAAHLAERLRIITDGAMRTALRLEDDVTSGRTRRMRPEEIRAQTASMNRQGSAAWLEGESLMATVKSQAKLQVAAQQQATLDQQNIAKQRLQDQKDAAAQSAQVARQEFETQRQYNKLEAIDARATADQTTAAAKIAGERRLAITKTVLKSIVMMERAFGKVVQGVARTVLGALKGVLSGVKNMASKIGSAITAPFRRANKGINDGLDGALSQRTGLFRRSMGDQEQIVRRSVQRQKAEMEKLNQRTSTGVLGALTGRGMGGGLAALAGGFSIAAFMKEGYQEAVNLNEQMNKTKVLFGQSADVILNFAKTSVKAFGATKAEALEAAGNFGNLFRAANINEKQAADMSAYLVNLAGDLSSFNNVPINDVFDALRAGLVGETEPLRRFGIMLNETTLKQKALELGFGDGKKTLDAEAKAAAGFVAIFEQTSLAQGDFTRTSKEGANAQRVMGKALKELASSIMAKFLPVATIGINMLSKAFMAMNDVISNNTSPVLKTLRKVLIGAAAGIGALLAVKGAIEVFKLLGPTIKLALSPLGMFVIVAAAVGAGISVMMDKSKGLRDAMKSLGGILSSIWKTLKDAVAPVFEAIGNAISKYVVPAISSAITWLMDHLVPAFNAVVSFIRDTVIPGFYKFVAFILTRVYPVIKTIGRFIADAFMTAVHAVRDFFNAMLPLIQPAIDGVKSLASAIGSLFGGDTSKMGGGASDFFGGIVTTIGNIVSKIGELLAPVAKKIVEWLSSVFSPANVKSLIIGFLDFVETIGRVLGGIVSHPTFVKAVAGLIAAAAAIGGKFILGFVKGVIDNIPGLIGMIWDAFTAGLSAIWDNKGMFLLIIGGLVAVLPTLRRIFGRAGSDVGGGFMSGLKGTFVGAFDYVRGVFRAAGREVEREQKVLRKRLADINRERKVMGAGGISFGARPLTDKMLKTAERDLKALQDGYSKAQIAGMRFRYMVEQQYQSFRRLTTAAGNVAKGVVTMGRTIGQALKALTPSAQSSGVSAMGVLKSGFDLGFMQIRTGFRQMWTEMKRIAKENGTSVAKVAGETLATGLVSTIGGFMAGKAAGQSGGFGSGALTAAMSGLTAGLATGSPIVGAAAAGFGLLGSAIGATKKKADEFRQGVAKFADSMKTKLVEAVESGTFSLGRLKDAFDFSAVLAVTAGDVGISKQIGDNLDENVIKKLKQIGVNIGRDVVPLLKEANGDIDKFATLFGQKMFDLTTSSKEWRNAFGDDSAAVSKYIQQMMANGENMDNLQTRVSVLANEIGGATINGMDAATLAAKKQELALVELMVAHNNLVKPVFDTNAAIKDSAEKVFRAAEVSMNYAAVTADLAKAAANTTEEMHGLGREMKNSGSRDIQVNLDEVAKRIEILGVNADEAKQMLDHLFDFGGGDFQKSLDDALMSVDGLGPRISGQLELGTKVGAANARENLRTFGKSLADVIKAGVDTETILTPADAMNLTKDIFDAATAGLDPGSDAYKRIADEYNKALAGVQPVLDAAAATHEAQKFQEEVKKYLEEHPASTLVEAEVAIKNKEVTAEVTAKLKLKAVELSDKTGKSAERNPEAFAQGLLGKWNEGISVPATVKVTKPAATDVKRDFESIGLAADQGVVKGVRDNKQIVIAEMRRLAIDAKKQAEDALGIKSPSRVFGKIGRQVVEGFAVGIAAENDTAIAAVSEMAVESIQKAKDELGVKSPSTVFRGIGKNIMLGLASGIEGGAKAAADSAREAVRNVIDTAIAGVNSGQAALTSAAGELFAGLTGSDAAAPGGKGPLASVTSLGAITTATQSLQQQVVSAAQTAWETAKKPLSEMTAADLNILGESFVSLNATDVLGAQNISSLTSVLDSIAAYGETLIAQGTPIDQVIALVNGQVSSFYDMAVSLGFNGDQVAALIDQLGLSEEALQSFGDEVANIGQQATNAAPNTLPTVPVVTAPETNTATRSAAMPAQNRATSTSVTKTQVNNIELHLPYGDPQAVALAVANRAAVLV